MFVASNPMFIPFSSAFSHIFPGQFAYLCINDIYLPLSMNHLWITITPRYFPYIKGACWQLGTPSHRHLQCHLKGLLRGSHGPRPQHALPHAHEARIAGIRAEVGGQPPGRDGNWMWVKQCCKPAMGWDWLSITPIKMARFWRIYFSFANIMCLEDSANQISIVIIILKFLAYIYVYTWGCLFGPAESSVQRSAESWISIPFKRTQV